MEEIRGLPAWFRGADAARGADGADGGEGHQAGPGPEGIARARTARSGGRAVGQGNTAVRFIEKNLAAIAAFTARVFSSGAHSSALGLLQALDVRARIALAVSLVAAGAVSTETPVLAALIAVTVLLAISSRVPLRSLAARTMLPVAFTSLMVVPVVFGLGAVFPGERIMEFRPLGLDLAVTGDGLRTAGIFIARVAAMTAPVMLLGLVTRQADLFRGLNSFPLPAFFVSALFMAFRYVFILLRISEDSQLARRSRTLGADPGGWGGGGGGPGGARGYGRWLATRVALLFRRSLGTAEEVSMAMASRGFTGRVRTMPLGAMRRLDYLFIGIGSFVFFLALGL